MTMGFLIGLQHALEADHIAAVASLTADKTGLKRIARHGIFWGLGHAVMLSLFGGAVFALRLTLDAKLSGILEFAVGIMLVILGGRIVAKVIRDRIHFHVHRHREGDVHFHAHSHAGEIVKHRDSSHAHLHPSHGWRRSFSVGLMHGLAGSAALVALTASTASTPVLGLAFMALFGIGSTLGMAAFSAVIAVPLTLTAHTLTWANRGLKVSAGLVALSFGFYIMIENGMALTASL